MISLGIRLNDVLGKKKKKAGCAWGWETHLAEGGDSGLRIISVLGGVRVVRVVHALAQQLVLPLPFLSHPLWRRHPRRVPAVEHAATRRRPDLGRGSLGELGGGEVGAVGVDVGLV